MLELVKLVVISSRSLPSSQEFTVLKIRRKKKRITEVQSYGRHASACLIW